MRLVMKKTQLKTEEIRMKKVEESLKPTRSNSQLQIKLRRYMSKDTYNLGHAAQNATRALDQIDSGNKDKATEFVDRAELHNNISKRARKAHEIISQELRTRGLKTESTKPMKTLKQILGETDAYEPKSPDEKKFKAKHTIKRTDDVNGNDDKLFKASNVKPVDRETPENHGYNPGTDERVYEDNDALRKKAIKGRAKRETNKFIRDTKKTVAKNLAEKTIKEWDDKTDPTSPEAHKFDSSDFKGIVSRVKKHVLGLTGKKSVSYDNSQLKPSTSVKPKKALSSDQMAAASRFRKALDGKRHLSVVKEEKKRLSPRDFSGVKPWGSVPVFTGTGTSPDPKLHHIIDANPTTLPNGKKAHRILSSGNIYSDPHKTYNDYIKAGHDVFLIKPKEG